jgi:hypothetical protein
MNWFDRHPEDQVYLAFDSVVPLFRELNPEEEAEFRQNARENYVVGTEINEVFHPVWRDEARKMNDEASFPPDTVTIIGGLDGDPKELIIDPPL